MTTEKKPNGRPKGEPTTTLTVRVKKSDFSFFSKLKNRNQFILDCIKQTPEYQRWLAKRTNDDKIPALF